MKVIINPSMDPQREIDLTDRLVAVIAEELWRMYGGNETLNWLEAERHLQSLLEGGDREGAGPCAAARPRRSSQGMRGTDPGDFHRGKHPSHAVRTSAAHEPHRQGRQHVELREVVLCADA